MDYTNREADILIALSGRHYYSQRELAAATGHALGVVNRAVRALAANGYVEIVADGTGSNEIRLTGKADSLLESHRPRNAVILAAGFGMRMVPINLESPKALLRVRGQRLIERIIEQLQNAGVEEIHVVVGFMKEKFEYLMDRYGVDLIVNRDYAVCNNLHSLALAERYISNTYIVPSDIWCAQNPFSSAELYPWYMVTDEKSADSDVRVNRKNELVMIRNKADRESNKETNRLPNRDGNRIGNVMVGISYLCGEAARTVRENLRLMSADPRYNNCFWEEALYMRRDARSDRGGGNDRSSIGVGNSRPGRMIAAARVVPANGVAEINTYEQLRELDAESPALKTDVIDVIRDTFHVPASAITDITVLKKGMTNRSFRFDISAGEPPTDEGRSRKYIMRIPGEGTDRLISRANEADVYRAISGRGLCDDPVYLNPDNGFKITKFLDGVRVCDPKSDSDLVRCMDLLRRFHSMNLQVGHVFDIFGQIRFYRDLCGGTPSVFDDYVRTSENVFSLKEYIDRQQKDWCLTHIDAVPDNFLFYRERPEDSREKLQLTDWEYAGMQDPHVDIAMFCIYSLYDRAEADHLIDLYFAGEDGNGSCPEEVRTKIYCYISACGLLWSNWCEYKAHLGVEFGEYFLRQYRYAKDYYRYARERME